LEDRIALNYSFGATPFQWVNLVPGSPGVFTVIQYADDAAAPVDIGTNTFNFYGTTYTGATGVWAGADGLITFGSGDASFIPTDLTTNPYQASIAPLWYDLFKYSGGPMILAQVDTANNQLIIEWNQVRDFQTSNLLTFEAVLQLNTGVNPGNITINYSTVDYFGSGGGTVGIKDVGPQGPNMALVAYRTQSPLVGNNEAIQFTWNNPIVIPSISSISPGTGSEGSAALGLTVNGSNFTTASIIEVNGVGLTTTFVNGTQLQATLTSSMLAEEGSLTITVLNPGPFGGTSNSQNFTITDAPLSASGMTVNPTEGNLFSGMVATFTDADPFGTATDYLATINWGDGSTSAGTIVANANGTFGVMGSHTYAEEGSRAVSVTVRDTGGSNTVASATSMATTLDAPLSGSGALVAATEGAAFNGVVASFADQYPSGPPSDFSAIIHWGDGSSSNATISPNGSGGFNVGGAHIYAEEGSYTLSVTINDIGGASATVSGTANVADAALTATGLTVSATEGISFTGAVASFADADPNGAATDYTVTISWGDGNTSLGTVSAIAGGFSIMGTHTYAEEGPYSVTVSIADAGGASSSTGGTASVADAALAVAGNPVASTEGALFKGVVASFTDGNPGAPTADFSATITWGDGHTSAGIITPNGSGGFNVVGSNTYAEEGSYPISVQISDAGGAKAGASSAATVTDAALNATGTSIAGTEGVSCTGVVASFTDANVNATASEFTATIVWGDGSSSAGVVSANGSGGFNVSGTHVYAAEGSNPITVVVQDAGGSTAQAHSTATVADSIPVVHASLRHGHNPHEVFVTVNFSDSALEDHQLLINWGDGTTSLIDLGVGTGGTYILRHLYHGHLRHHLQIVVTVLDDDGTSSAPVALTVNFNEGHHHHHEHHHHHHEEGSVWDRSDWDGFSWES
jgi:hypothetical protein